MKLSAAATARLKALKTSAARLGGSLALNALGLGGAAWTVFGVWMIYRPAGHILGGLLCLTATFLLARGASASAKPPASAE